MSVCSSNKTKISAPEAITFHGHLTDIVCKASAMPGRAAQSQPALEDLWTWLLAASLKLLYFCLNPRPVSGVRQQLTVPTGNSISPGHKSKLMVSCWSRRKLVPFMFCERLRLILEIANRICQAISRFLIATHATLLRPRPCFQFSLFVHPASGRRLTLSRTLPSRRGSDILCLV